MTIHNINTQIKNVDKIVHIADVHIRPYKRHQEYREVFNRLYKSISKNTTVDSIIVLVGDIVHAKTEMSPELVSMLSEFLVDLSSLCTVILAPGNHDGNLNNLNRLDTLSPVVTSLNLPRLHYLKESGIYSFANLYFSNMSVFDSEDKYVLAKDMPGNGTKIALFHGAINNSVNDFNFKLKSNTGVSMFNGFDYVLLGDIHKMQMLQDFNIEETEVDEEQLEKYIKNGWEIKNN